MGKREGKSDIVPLDASRPLWDRCFMVAPLVLVGTREPDGSLDFAPKHMAMPMGWENYFGFVCSPRHRTAANIAERGEFTVSYPRPSQVLYASLAASPRCDDGAKPVIGQIPTFPAGQVDGAFVEDGYLFLECRHYRTIDGFGPNCLITGEIVAAWASPDYLRSAERDDHELVHRAPLVAYLPPGRFATIERSFAFPFPAQMKR